MKIDVQGYELPVLLGGEETIAREQPIILIESVTNEQMDFLNQFGYRLYRFDRSENKFITNETGKINSFLMTNAKYELLTQTNLNSG